MKITQPGIYRDFDTADYFADPTPGGRALSQSIAKILIEQSPLHARQAHPRLATKIEGLDEDDAGEKYDKAKAIGNAVHLLMMKRGKKLAVEDFPDWRSKDAKAFKAAAIEDGSEPILRKHWLVANAMHLAARLQLANIPGCERAFTEGDGEVVIASCEDGMWLKSMVDWITPDVREIWDFKSTGMSASPYVMGAKMSNDGWHIQAAAIERILDAVDPEGAGRRVYRFVCQEQDEPFSLTVNEIGEGALTMGRKMFDYAARAWRECLASGVWPAYPPRIIIPAFPGWKENAWLEREIAEEENIHPTFKSGMLKSLAGG